MNKVEVLIVDDNVDLAENLAEILEYEGFSCRIAEGGKIALGYLAEQTFDLVITDLKMPEMDGLALLREINRKWPQTPVVLMTAYARDQQVDAARREGALEILSKPLNTDLLLRMVERLADEGPKRVLIVEDDDDLRENLVEIVSDIPLVEVRATGSVAQARRELEQGSFDIAIVDIRLPDGDGVELGRELAEGPAPRARLVLMTAYPDEFLGTLRALALEKQPKVLHKPFPPAILVALVRGAI